VERTKSDPVTRKRVKEELGDILIYALNMCHAFGFDPSEVILEKLKLNENKYPVDKAKGSVKKHTES
jgi:dCTP diphosphatase